MKNLILSLFLFASPLVAQVQLGKNVQIGAGGGSGTPVLFQHNGVDLVQQFLLNFDDTIPAPPSGNINGIFQTDSAGHLSVYVPFVCVPVTGGTGFVDAVKCGSNNALAATGADITTTFSIQAIGEGASHITGSHVSDVVAIGDEPVSATFTGSHDIVAIGDAADHQCENPTFTGCGPNLPNPILQHDNVFIGDAPGLYNQGSDNVGTGHQALGSTFFFTALGFYNQGSFNVADGTYSLVGNTTGTQNVGIGAYAGGDGYQDFPGNVMGNANHTGSRNTWIGYDSGPNTTTQLSNTIALGYQAHNTASNQTTIGNSSTTSLLIFGCPTGQSVLNDGSGTCYTPGAGGGGPTLQTNGVSNTSQSTLNFVNPSAFNGLTFTFSNPTAGNETFAVGGTLGNAGLANPSMTINSTTCTLGGSCTVSGGGGVSGSGTTGFVPLWSGSTALGNSHIDEVTTAGVDTFTQPVAVNDGTGKAGNIGLLAGTAPTAAPTSTIQINAPTAVTAYAINLPGAQPSTGTFLSCTAANPAVCSWAAATGSTGFPITLGSTSIGSSSTTTAVTGLTVNGVTLNAAGSASLFLNQAGGYTAPAGGGTVTSFSAGTLSPLFTTSVATATSTPALSFTLSNAAAHSFLGNGTGSSAAPAYSLIGTNDWSPNAYIAGAGSVNVMTATLSPAATALVAGLEVDVLPNLANTTTTPTLNVNGLGAKTITKLGTAALAAGDYSTTAIAKLIYDGTVWQLQNPQTSSGGGGISGLTTGFIPKAASSTTIANSLLDDGVSAASTLTYTGTGGAVINGILVSGSAGTNSVFIGPGVGTWTNFNTFVGFDAGNACASGSGSNTAFGNNAMRSDSVCGNNVAVGDTSLYSVGSPSQDVAIGASAGKSQQTTGSTFVGYSSVLGAAVDDVTMVGANTTTSTAHQAIFGTSTTTSTILGGVTNLTSSDGFQSKGTKFSVTGCGTATSLTGGGTAGSFVGASASCTPVVTMSTTAANGWACHMNDFTTSTAAFRQTATSTTTATFTAGGTVGATDTINFFCMAY